MSDRNRIARATERMTHYLSTYNQQPAFNDYTDKTFVLDMFYGIAISLGYEAGPDGFAKFKSDWKIGA